MNSSNNDIIKEIKKQRRDVIITTSILVSMLLFCYFSGRSRSKAECPTIKQKIEDSTLNQDLKLSKENVLFMLHELDFNYPKIVYAQIILESANLTSNLAINNNNITGMKLARSRETTAIGERNNHALYEDWIDCLKDRKLFDDYYISGLDENGYLDYLGKHYAVDPNYLNKIETIISQLN